jgi:HK97 family phage prohead protease
MVRYKSFEANVKADADEGIVEAIVSVFGVVDSYNERVLPGAFAKSLERKKPAGVWMHDPTLPVAETVEAFEMLPGDPRLPESIRNYGGLYIKGRFNFETQRGREAFSDVKKGIITEFSIGYYLVDSERAEDGVLNIKEVDLVEWSPVLRGANPATLPLAVRAQNDDFSQSGLRLTEHIAFLADSIEVLEARLRSVKELRAAKGKDLGEKTRGELARLCERLDSLRQLSQKSDDIEVQRRRLAILAQLYSK